MKANNSSGTNPQHISMELTADSARVTSLSLKGNRLVLTIEAQLADSQLNAGADATPAEPVAKQSIEDAKFVEPSCAATDEDSAWFVPVAPAPGEQEETRLVDTNTSALEEDARENSDTDVIGELARDIGDGTIRDRDPVVPSGNAPIIGLAPEPLAADDDSIVASISLEPAFQADEETSWDVQAKQDAPVVAGASAEPAAQDEGGDDLWNSFDEPVVVAPPLEPVRDATDTWDTLHESGQAMPRLEGVNTVLADEPKAEARPDAIPGADKPLEPSVDDTEWGIAAAEMPPAPPLEPVKELTDTWDNVAESVSDMTSRTEEEDEPGADLPAIADESSVIGGERHGEPQPALSFGVTDQPAKPAEPEQPAPAAEPEPAPTPEPSPAPEPALSEHPQPEPQSGPEQEPEPQAKAPAHEPGGTTVLIRYTCPRCKTQGMQAVDKVGTVVNCSNCGKAMRLVMKK